MYLSRLCVHFTVLTLQIYNERASNLGLIVLLALLQGLTGTLVGSTCVYVTVLLWLSYKLYTFRFYHIIKIPLVDG